MTERPLEGWTYGGLLLTPPLPAEASDGHYSENLGRCLSCKKELPIRSVRRGVTMCRACVAVRKLEGIAQRRSLEHKVQGA